jgi:hypothetical protein
LITFIWLLARKAPTAAPKMVIISKGSAFRIGPDVAAVGDEHAEHAAQGDDPTDDDEHGVALCRTARAANCGC